MFFDTPILKDFSHYTNVINEIRHALNSELNILINGFSGCGKSTIINLMLIEKGYEVLFINSSNYENLASIKNRVTCFVKTNTIQSFINKQSKIIFVDDLDVIMNIDRNFFSFITEFINSNVCSLICANNPFMNKKILNTKDCFQCVLDIKRLSYKQCFQIIVAHLPDTMMIDYDKLTILIKENNNDLRTVANNIHEVLLGRSTYFLKKRPKYFEMNITEIIEELCSSLLSENEINEIVTLDINQIVSSLHENIYQLFSSRVLDTDELKCMKEFNEIVINSEYIGKYIFDKYDFATWDHYTYDKIKYMNHLLFHHFKKYSTPIRVKISHSQLINKQSLALNFNKKIIKMEKDHDISRLDCSSVIFYLYSIIHSSMNKVEIIKFVTKNDFEITTRFLSDFLPEQKQRILKLKNSMLK